jgi:predicted GIY-YIG superfamily endonuclease
VHFVYIVRCADGTLYTGYARDPDARAKAHNNGRGARYTSGRRPVALVYVEACRSRGEALSREHRLKLLRRERKEALIAKAGAARRRSTDSTTASLPADTRPRVR